MYSVNDDNIKHAVKFSIQALGNNANLNWIDTSDVTNMQNMFYGSRFNGNISKWNVSSVKNMAWMFKYS